MIAELDRYHGIVLRQLLIAHGRPMRVGILDQSGRVDAFRIEEAAFMVKHSSKRLSPWQFTYTAENLAELTDLGRIFSPVWTFLVCGQDGVVGLAMDDLAMIVAIADRRAAWVRVSRSRNAMYRVSGPVGDFPRAVSRGVQAFLGTVFAGGTV